MERHTTPTPAPKEHHTLYQHPHYPTDLREGQQITHPWAPTANDEEGDPAHTEGTL